MEKAWTIACNMHTDAQALTNAERGNDCYDAVIKHKMSQDSAKRLLEFFGSLADEGHDPVRFLATMMASYKTYMKTITR